MKDEINGKTVIYVMPEDKVRYDNDLKNMVSHNGDYICVPVPLKDIRGIQLPSVTHPRIVEAYNFIRIKNRKLTKGDLVMDTNTANLQATLAELVKDVKEIGSLEHFGEMPRIDTGPEPKRIKWEDE
jgi:hypothetical protein